MAEDLSGTRAMPRRRRRAGVALVSSIMLAGALIASPAAIATWNKALTGTGSLAAGTITTTSSLTVLDTRISNDDYQTTQVAEVRNTVPAGSSYTGTLDATFTVNAMGNTGLASMMSVSVWPVASIAACTVATAPAGNAVSAAWTAGLISAASPVAPNASAYFCVRGFPTNSTPLPASTATAVAQNRSNVAAQLGSAATLSFTPNYTGQVKRGNFSASAATTPAYTLSTFRIFPFSQLTTGTLNVGVPALGSGVTGLCFNISAVVPGNNLVIFTCSTAATTLLNERFTEVPVPGTGSFQIQANSTTSTSGFLEATADGTLVKNQNSDASNLRQRWIGQVLSNGSRHFINAETGYCLFAPSANLANVTTQPCNNLLGESSNWSAARL